MRLPWRTGQNYNIHVQYMVHVSCNITTVYAQSILMCLYMQTKPPADDLEETEKRLLPVAGDPPHASLPPLLPPLRNLFVSILALFPGSPLCPEPGQAWELGCTYVTNCPSPSLFLLSHLHFFSSSSTCMSSLSLCHPPTSPLSHPPLHHLPSHPPSSHSHSVSISLSLLQWRRTSPILTTCLMTVWTGWVIELCVATINSFTVAPILARDQVWEGEGVASLPGLTPPAFIACSMKRKQWNLGCERMERLPWIYHAICTCKLNWWVALRTLYLEFPYHSSILLLWKKKKKNVFQG